MFLDSDNYFDHIANEPSKFVQKATIESKRIEHSSLHVFLRHQKDLEDAIYFQNATLKPIKDKRGFGGSGIIRVSVKDSTLSTTALEDYLKTLEEIVTLELDSVIV